jgi:homoserine kinase
LGSSATAIVGGLIGANQLAGEPLERMEVMQLAIAMEGHPDNVVPALLGGCRLAATGLTNEPQKDTAQGVSLGRFVIFLGILILFPSLLSLILNFLQKRRGVFCQAITAVLMPFLILPI